MSSLIFAVVTEEFIISFSHFSVDISTRAMDACCPEITQFKVLAISESHGTADAESEFVNCNGVTPFALQRRAGSRSAGAPVFVTKRGPSDPATCGAEVTRDFNARQMISSLTSTLAQRRNTGLCEGFACTGCYRGFTFVKYS